MKKIFTLILLVILMITLTGCSIYDEEDEQTAIQDKECRERSNTYQKCSWSYSEDMCTCKNR